MRESYPQKADPINSLEHAYDAKAGRKERPMRIWPEWLLSLRLMLAHDEFAVVMYLYIALWTSDTTALPYDEKLLAHVAGVTPRQWCTRFWPKLSPHFIVKDGQIFSPYVQKEAKYVEKNLAAQSQRRRGKKSDNMLLDMDVTTSADQPADNPSHLPNSPTHYTAAASAQAQERGGLSMFHRRLFAALGRDPDHPQNYGGHKLGSPNDLTIVNHWLSLPGMSEDSVCDVIADIMKRPKARLPHSLAYFDAAMAEHAAVRARPACQPLPLKKGKRPTARLQINTAIFTEPKA